MEDTHKLLNPTTATTTIPTFQLQGLKANDQQQHSDEDEMMTHNENADAHDCILRLRTNSRRKKKKKKKKRTRDNIQRNSKMSCGGGGGGDDDDQKEELESKIVALQRIVPGGETLLGVDKLFEETADYILALQCQIEAMKALTNFIEGLEMQKRKFGA